MTKVRAAMERPEWLIRRICAGTWSCAAGSLAIVFALSSYAAGLADTGQDLCYNGSSMVACSSGNTGDAATYKRQDGRYGRDAAATGGEPLKLGAGAKGFDYTALDGSGNATGASSGATPHACVRDNATSLIWEVKTDNGGLHDKDWLYTWLNTSGSSNGGNAGTAGGATCGGTLGACDTETLITTVNTAGWCGCNTWRLPSERELLTLVHYGSVSPAIEATYFPNTPATVYWTRATYALDVSQAWRVGFGYGGANTQYKSDALSVRLVCGGPL